MLLLPADSINEGRRGATQKHQSFTDLSALERKQREGYCGQPPIPPSFCFLRSKIHRVGFGGLTDAVKVDPPLF